MLNMLLDAVTFSDSDQKTLFLLLLQLGIEKLQIKSLQQKLYVFLKFMHIFMNLKCQIFPLKDYNDTWFKIPGTSVSKTWYTEILLLVMNTELYLSHVWAPRNLQNLLYIEWLINFSSVEFYNTHFIQYIPKLFCKYHIDCASLRGCSAFKTNIIISAHKIN